MPFMGNDEFITSDSAESASGSITSPQSRTRDCAVVVATSRRPAELARERKRLFVPNLPIICIEWRQSKAKGISEVNALRSLGLGFTNMVELHGTNSLLRLKFSFSQYRI